MKFRPSLRTRRMAIGTTVVLALSGANGPWLYRESTERYHDYTINKPGYKAANGHWDFLDVPAGYRINTIHAALLHTGKVLLVAGSGNNRKNFDAKSFRSVLWDPRTGAFKNIPTPDDMFCSGHTQLSDGKLLIAGGTRRYEKLKGDVTKAGGLMIVHNENPDRPVTLPAGTRFTGRANGRTFVSKDPVLVEKATKVFDRRTRRFLHNDAGLGRIYVEAEKSGARYATGAEDNYRIAGLTGSDTRDVYGIAQKIALDKKDFQGIREAFEFDPVAEKYISVDPMNEALVPDADHPEGRPGPRPLRAGRDRADRSRQGRDLRPEDQEVAVHRHRPEVPHLPRGLPAGRRQALLLRLERRIRPRRRRPRPGRLGPGDQQLQEDPRTGRRRRDGDLRDGPAAPGPGREVHGHRRRRGR